MKRSALLLALIPAFAFAQGEAHLSATTHLIYAKPSGGSDAWKAVGPRDTTYSLYVRNSYQTGTEFPVNLSGIYGKVLGPVSSNDEHGVLQAAGVSHVTQAAAPDDFSADFSLSGQYASDNDPASAFASQTCSVTKGDFEKEGMLGGSSVDLYTQVTLRKGTGYGADTDARGRFDLTATFSGYNVNGGAPNVQVDIASMSAPISSDAFDPQFSGTVYPYGQKPDGAGIEVYLLGANAEVAGATPEDRLSAADATRIDTLSYLGLDDLIASDLSSDGTLLKDISIGFRYRNLKITTFDNPEYPVFSSNISLLAGQPVPEPVSCLALSLGAVAVLRRNPRKVVR